MRSRERYRRFVSAVCALTVTVSLVVLWALPAGATVGEENHAEQFAQSVRDSDFPASEWWDVVSVARCESRGTFVPSIRGDLHLPGATDGLGSIGPMQINGGNLYGRRVHPALRSIRVDNFDAAAVVAWLSDNDNNLVAAHAIWSASGWTEWACVP